MNRYTKGTREEVEKEIKRRDIGKTREDVEERDCIACYSRNERTYEKY